MLAYIVSTVSGRTVLLLYHIIAISDYTRRKRRKPLNGQDETYSDMMLQLIEIDNIALTPIMMHR